MNARVINVQFGRLCCLLSNGRKNDSLMDINVKNNNNKGQTTHS